MKKILLTSSLVLANMVFGAMAMAGGMNAPAYGQGEHMHRESPRLFTGFSVTGALGGLMGDTEITQVSFVKTETMDVFEVEQEFLYNPYLSETSIAGMVGVEYDYQFPSGLLLGLAATAGFESLELKITQAEIVQQSYDFPGDFGHDTTTLNTAFKTKLKNDFALLVKPGFVVRHNTLLYALIGPRWGNFESYLSGTANTQGSATDIETIDWNITASGSEKSSGYHLGFTAGAGIQQAITNHFRVGIEYAYSRYPNMDDLSVNNHNDGSMENPAFARVVTSVDGYTFVTNSVMGTLSYKF